MKLSELKKNLHDLSEEELFDLLRNVRDDRRRPKKTTITQAKKHAKTTTPKKTFETLLGQLSESDAAEILATLMKEK